MIRNVIISNTYHLEAHLVYIQIQQYFNESHYFIDTWSLTFKLYRLLKPSTLRP